MNPIDIVVLLLEREGLKVVPEFVACPPRRWRWDLLVYRIIGIVGISETVLIEINGGTRMRKGAHNTHDAITRDCQKARAATLAGYRQLSYTTAEIMVDPDLVVREVKACLEF